MGQAISESLARLMNEHPEHAPEVRQVLTAYLNDPDGDVRVLAASTLLHPSVRAVVSDENTATSVDRPISTLKERDSYHPDILNARHGNAILALKMCQALPEGVIASLREWIAATSNQRLQQLASEVITIHNSIMASHTPAVDVDAGEKPIQEVTANLTSVAKLLEIDPKLKGVLSAR